MPAIYTIYIGDPSSPTFNFSEDEIINVSIDTSVHLVGEELHIDTMDAEVHYEDTEHSLVALQWGTPIYCYSESNLEGKFYCTEVKRTGANAYRIRSVSAAGILDYETYYGGIYTGETLDTVIERVVGSNGLQPYNGIYTSALHEYEINNIHDRRGYFLGKWEDSAREMEGGGPTYGSGAAFWKATMSSKMHAKSTFISHKLNDGFTGTGTSFRIYILGALAHLRNASNAQKLRYGLYMEINRNSENDAWPEYGEVVFVYGETQISLGVPTGETTYEIDVDPVGGTAVINGVSYPIAYNSALADSLTPLHYYGSGCGMYNFNDEKTSVYADGDTSDWAVIKSGYYTITSQSGEVQCDVVTVKNVHTGEVLFLDLANWKYSNYNVGGIRGNTIPLIEDLYPYDGSYGESPLFNVLTESQKDIVASITYASGVETLPVYGWLPVCSKREAIHQLLFSQGVIIIKDGEGKLLFTSPRESSVGSITSDETYNDGSEEPVSRINAINLTEHSFTYVADSEAVVIAKNEGAPGSGTYLVMHENAPIEPSSITADGMTVIMSNCNASIVSGSGTLSGKPYVHGKAIVNKQIATYPDGRLVSVSDATLVTLQNSGIVLDRLSAYYSNAKKVSIDIVQKDQKCGLFYDAINSFGEAFSGFLTKANKRFSSIIKSACELIVGYTPPPLETGYTNYVILTGNGTWEVPASVYEKDVPRIRMVLIGGGKGGYSGLAGSDGNVTPRGGSSTPNRGGSTGGLASAGRVLEVEIRDPDSTVTYSCGVGGAGAAICTSKTDMNVGEDGTDTEASCGGTAYSSIDGSVLSNGYANFFTGDIYASRFILPNFMTQSKGGDGGYIIYALGQIIKMKGGNCLYNFNNVAHFYGPGDAGNSVTDSSGGTYATGGMGGGAGYGSTGGRGGNATKSGSTYRAGNGGNGGDAVETPPKATVYNAKYYGYGGHPGGGGGAGGNSGFASSNFTTTTGNPGKGGYGGRGGDGGDGCVLIYY